MWSTRGLALRVNARFYAHERYTLYMGKDRTETGVVPVERDTIICSGWALWFLALAVVWLRAHGVWRDGGGGASARLRVAPSRCVGRSLFSCREVQGRGAFAR